MVVVTESRVLEAHHGNRDGERNMEHLGIPELYRSFCQTPPRFDELQQLLRGNTRESLPPYRLWKGDILEDLVEVPCTRCVRQTPKAFCTPRSPALWHQLSC
jgi:hypothetical protein